MVSFFVFRCSNTLTHKFRSPTLTGKSRAHFLYSFSVVRSLEEISQFCWRFIGIGILLLWQHCIRCKNLLHHQGAPPKNYRKKCARLFPAIVYSTSRTRGPWSEFAPLWLKVACSDCPETMQTNKLVWVFDGLGASIFYNIPRFFY